MFNSEKMRKALVVVMFVELLILLGLLVNDHIQAENQLRQQVHKLTVQIATLTQEQQKTATELTTVKQQVQTVSNENAVLKEENKAIKSQTSTHQADVQKLKKCCSEKTSCKSKCKSKCKDKSGCGNARKCPQKDNSTKKPECGNDKGTTSPPAMHQVEMYYGAVKTIVSVPSQ